MDVVMGLRLLCIVRKVLDVGEKCALQYLLLKLLFLQIMDV